ncbi:MAG: hypothetical protein ACLGG0_08660 [Bacteriovoracia bacterium]
MIFTRIIAALILTIDISFAVEIEYQGRINIAEYQAKTVRHSWCIFSDGNSSVDTSVLSRHASGSNNSHYENYSHRGTSYLKRKVEWTNTKDENSINLHFTADSAQFSAHQEYDKKTCSYKTWKGQSTSAETILKAKAAFVIPKNVWAIKISSNQEHLQGQLAINLSNNEYIIDESGEEKLLARSFHQFSSSQNERYFQVNPSFDGGENFVYLDMIYKSRTLVAQEFLLDFKVEFIANEQCLTELKGRHFADLLTQQIKSNELESTLINFACMMNTDYVQHVLGQLHLHGTNDLFSKIAQVENSAIKSIRESSNANDREKLALILKLSERMRFYYAYEILKETMGMLVEQVDHNGQSVDAWMYLELLRRRGVLYLAEVLEHLSLAGKQQLAQNSGPVITFSHSDRLKHEVFFQSILPMEFNSFKKANELIFKPLFLSADYFYHLQRSIERISTLSTYFITTYGTQLTQSITRATLEKMNDDIMSIAKELRLYSQEVEVFKITQLTDAPQDWVQARRLLLQQMELVFQMNLASLSTEVGTYFKRHFEDPIFKEIRIKGKRYENAEHFLKDFEQLIREVRL